MPNHRLDLEYHGAAYRGWQAQRNARTVAGALQAAFGGAFRDVRQFVGAGRTDAGVHALHQVAHVRSLGAKAPAGKLVHVLNDALPPDVAVQRVREVPDDFDARRDAIGRVYRYQIQRRRSAFGADTAWWVRDALDVGEMRKAAAAVSGNHDFAAFSDLDPERPRDTRVDLGPVELVEEGSLLLLRFRARFFLWKMARRLTGYLVEVGRGRYKSGLAPAMFTQDRKVLAPYTAPPHGLFLERVLYAGDAHHAPLTALPPPPPGATAGKRASA